MRQWAPNHMDGPAPLLYGRKVSIIDVAFYQADRTKGNSI